MLKNTLCFFSMSIASMLSFESGETGCELQVRSKGSIASRTFYDLVECESISSKLREFGVSGSYLSSAMKQISGDNVVIDFYPDNGTILVVGEDYKSVIMEIRL